MNPSDAHVLVVGVGGIGCPAAWALADENVGRLTIVDPDVVETSNLPRQVLFQPNDVGRPKAEVAARRLAHGGRTVRGVAGRLDGSTAPDLLRGVDVLVDATDGALVKDWINALAVRRRLPYVHAAGLGSEGRLLDVAPGGKPCLACLFGRLAEEQGSCAELGVWNGVVGVVGFLAASLAIARVREPEAPCGGYRVFDLAAGSAQRFAVKPDERCPVCGPAASREEEPYPEAVSCATVPSEPARSEHAHGVLGGAFDKVLDLREEHCPMNLLRARRAVETTPLGTMTEILLNEEGSRTVPDGLARLGHRVVAREAMAPAGLRLRVATGGRRERRLDEAALRRFARQVVLPEVGEPGQARWIDARVTVHGTGETADVAATYLAAAGVGHVLRRDADGCAALAPDGTPFHVVSEARGLTVVAGIERRPAEPLRGPVAKAAGALLADQVLRHVALGSAPSLDFALPSA